MESLNLAHFAEAYRTTLISSEKYKNESEAEFKRNADYFLEQFSRDFGDPVRKNLGSSVSGIQQLSEQLKQLSNFLMEAVPENGKLEGKAAEEFSRVVAEVKHMLKDPQTGLEQFLGDAALIKKANGTEFGSAFELRDNMEKFIKDANTLLPDELQHNISEKAVEQTQRDPAVDRLKTPAKNINNHVNPVPEQQNAPHSLLQTPPVAPALGAGGTDLPKQVPYHPNEIAPAPRAPDFDKEGNPILPNATAKPDSSDQSNNTSASTDAVASGSSNASTTSSEATNGMARSISNKPKENDNLKDKSVQHHMYKFEQDLIARGFNDEQRQEVLKESEGRIAGLSPALAATAIQNFAREYVTNHDTMVVNKSHLLANETREKQEKQQVQSASPFGKMVDLALAEAGKIGKDLQAAYNMILNQADDKQLSYLASATTAPKLANQEVSKTQLPFT